MKRLLLLPILLFLSLLHGQSAVAQATNEPTLSLVIRGPTNIIKQGDEIPIEFIISNDGAQDYNYDIRSADRAGLMPGFKLLIKTTSGEELPDIRMDDNLLRHARSRTIGFSILHPGQALTNIVTLNRTALLIEPGRYEIIGGSRADNNAGKLIAAVSAAPIIITVLPRTKQEMDDYIKNLTNQIAARFPIKRTEYGVPFDPVLDGLLVKLMFACDPAIVPTMLRIIYESGINGNPNQGIEALLYYVPHTEGTKKAILEEAAKQGLSQNMYDLLTHYEVNKEELKPIIERALAEHNSYPLHFGAMLAGNSANYDDAFTARLIALACGTTNDVWVRKEAMRTLACNRTDEGVNALKSLLNDADPDTGAALAAAICAGYSSGIKSGLHRVDFSTNDVRALTERLLKSSTNTFFGLSLAEIFGDDALTPNLVAMATDSECHYRFEAIVALAMNRTDEAVKTLKMLLNGPDTFVSYVTEDAIRTGYNSRGVARGKPLRPDDFDAKYQHPETPPPK